MKKSVTVLLVALLFCFAAILPVSAASRPLLVDDADLLTAQEAQALSAKLDDISARQEADIVVVTVYSLYGESAMDYADDFFDDNGYGQGDGRDGVLLLVSRLDREWHISTGGYGITAITDAGWQYIGEQIVDDLSDGNYADAFDTYATLCDDFFTQANAGTPYDVDNLPKEPFNVVVSLLISLAVGLVVALIATAVMKGKLKSVKAQYTATNYIKDGSMQVTGSRDLFLYTHVNRVPRPKSNSGSGGSRTHTSSSGRSHGGGGGRF